MPLPHDVKGAPLPKGGQHTIGQRTCKANDTRCVLGEPITSEVLRKAPAVMEGF